MVKYECKICNLIFSANTKNLYGCRRTISKKFKEHLKKEHNIEIKEYIIKYYFDNNYPLCNCGCGKKLKFNEKNALWNPLESFGKYYDCGHVSRNNLQMINSLKETYKSKYEDITWLTLQYYERYGKENIMESLNDFLNDNSLTNIDISKKYNIDIRTLKTIWFRLNLITKEQWDERSLYRKYKVSSKHRRLKFENKEYICVELYNILKNKPLVFNIRELIRYYNDNNLVLIETDIPVIIKELENIYGEEIYNYLAYGNHSKEEKEFLRILKFFMKKWHYYKLGKPLLYGKTKRDSYIYDICIDNKYIIEYDGELFHNDETKLRDLEKENFAIDLGYKIIRISSKDFKNIEIYKQIINIIEND